MLAAKELIGVGRIFKVDKGEFIDVEDDPWIPEVGSTKILIGTIEGLEGARVSSLLKIGTNE